MFPSLMVVEAVVQSVVVAFPSMSALSNRQDASMLLVRPSATARTSLRAAARSSATVASAFR